MAAEQRLGSVFALICHPKKSTFLPLFRRCMGERKLSFTFGRDAVELQRNFEASGPRPAHRASSDPRPSPAVLVIDSWSWNSSKLGDLLTTVPGNGDCLQWVHLTSAGVDRAFGSLQKLRERNPRVLTTRSKGSYDRDLAEYALAAMLYFAKKIPRLNENKDKRVYDAFTVDTLAGKTLGIVGYGSIGREVARKAREGFEMKVIGLRRGRSGGSHGPAEGCLERVTTGTAGAARKGEFGRDANAPRPAEATSVSSGADCALGAAENVYSLLGPGATSKADFLRRCDFVVSALPHNADTTDFFSVEEFAAMRPSAVFVNIGRGSAVDEEALCIALEKRQFGGAALDVQRTEPLPPESPLWASPHVLLSPHNADVTDDAPARALAVFERNLDVFLRGARTNDDMHSPIDFVKGY